MALAIAHNVDKGVRQLLEAPLDLQEIAMLQGKAKPRNKATPAHRRLYKDYLGDFPAAYGIAENWWEGCINAYVNLGHNRDEAIDLAFDRRLAGPASAPEVVWFFRHYWLECSKLNESLPLDKRVPPQTLLLGWLVNDDLRDYFTLLTCMPYWPLGLDENGNWC